MERGREERIGGRERGRAKPFNIFVIRIFRNNIEKEFKRYFSRHILLFARSFRGLRANAFVAYFPVISPTLNEPMKIIRFTFYPKAPLVIQGYARE